MTVEIDQDSLVLLPTSDPEIYNISCRYTQDEGETFDTISFSWNRNNPGTLSARIQEIIDKKNTAASRITAAKQAIISRNATTIKKFQPKEELKISPEEV